MAYRCARCGFLHPDNFLEEWGRAPETVGMGTNPMCTQLVQDKARPQLPDGSYPLATCRGQVHFSAEGESSQQSSTLDRANAQLSGQPRR